MRELPLGWERMTLGDLVILNYGKSLPESVRQSGKIPVYGSNGLVGFHAAALTHGPTIVVGRKGSIGEIHLSLAACFPIDTTYYIDKFFGLEPRFVEHLLRTLKLTELNRATAIPGLNREDAYAIAVSLPPNAEQRRIVAKLDGLLGRTARARKELNHVSRLVARHKQAVLTSAFSGELTKEWRARVRDVSTAGAAVESIRSNRADQGALAACRT